MGTEWTGVGTNRESVSLDSICTSSSPSSVRQKILYISMGVLGIGGSRDRVDWGTD